MLGLPIILLVKFKATNSIKYEGIDNLFSILKTITERDFIDFN